MKNGRATKVFIAKEIEPNATKLEWFSRSVAITLQSERDQLTLVGSHFAYQAAWEESLTEVASYITDLTRVILVGDRNIESRRGYQSHQDRSRWDCYVANWEVGRWYIAHWMLSLRGEPSRSQKYIVALTISLFSTPVFATCSGSWEGALGDHCWLSWRPSFRTEWKKQQPRRWRCDWDKFVAYIGAESPDNFETWTTAETWLADVVEDFTVTSSRRQRRASWEPFRIKILRAKIRSCTDDVERNTLLKRLYSFQKQWAADRERAQMRGDMKSGKNLGKRSKTLFPVLALEGHHGVTRDAAELPTIAKDEFSWRWQPVADRA